jgi:hypothetical protein
VLQADELTNAFVHSNRRAPASPNASYLAEAKLGSPLAEHECNPGASGGDRVAAIEAGRSA